MKKLLSLCIIVSLCGGAAVAERPAQGRNENIPQAMPGGEFQRPALAEQAVQQNDMNRVNAQNQQRNVQMDRGLNRIENRITKIEARLDKALSKLENFKGQGQGPVKRLENLVNNIEKLIQRVETRFSADNPETSAALVLRLNELISRTHEVLNDAPEFMTAEDAEAFIEGENEEAGASEEEEEE